MVAVKEICDNHLGGCQFDSGLSCMENRMVVVKHRQPMHNTIASTSRDQDLLKIDIVEYVRVERDFRMFDALPA